MIFPSICFLNYITMYNCRSSPPCIQLGFPMIATTFSPDRKYRYVLARSFGYGMNTIAWCMLNPSTADEANDDPTIRRCIGFSTRWGYDRMLIVNLSPLRATQPAGMIEAGIEPKAIRDANDDWILKAASIADQFVIAYGTFGTYENRDRHLIELMNLKGHSLWCLGTTKAGHPRHPLYVPYSQPLTIFDSELQHS